MFRLLWAFVLFSFFACSDKEPVAGTGSETETTIAGKLVDETGTPVAKALLRIRKETLVSTWKDSTHTSDEGTFQFQLPSAGTYFLHYEYEGKVNSRSFEVAETQKLELPSDTLLPATQLYGVVKNSLGQSIPSVVHILGSHLSAVQDTAGGFTLNGVNTGHSYNVHVAPQDTSYQGRSFLVEVSLDTLALYVSKKEEVATLLLEDFEDGDSLGLMHEFNGASEWWQSSLHGVIEQSVVENEVACSFCQSPLNKVLYAKMTIDTAQVNEYAAVGLNLLSGWNETKGGDYIDLSKMGYLAFKARGTGVLKVQFASELCWVEANNNIQFNKSIDLNHHWQTYVIAGEDLKNILWEEKTLTWDVAKTKVWALSFVAEQDAEFWIDDLEIQGLSQSDFTKSL